MAVARKRATVGLSAGLLATAVVAGGTATAQQPGSQQSGSQQQPADATAEMMDSNGGTVGEVRIRNLAQGTLFIVELANIPEGAHGFHVHETGTCEPPDFESAGAHYAPLDNNHGYATRRGYHGGDLPNVHASANGWVRAEFFVPHLALTEERGQSAGGDDSSAFAPDAPGPFPLLDDDGSAVLVHENPDDYETQSSGNAGGRIACGVIEPTGNGSQGQGQGGQGQDQGG